MRYCSNLKGHHRDPILADQLKFSTIGTISKRQPPRTSDPGAVGMGPRRPGGDRQKVVIVKIHLIYKVTQNDSCKKKMCLIN